MFILSIKTTLRYCFLVLCCFLCAAVCAQSTDTLRTNGKILLRDRMIVTLDTIPIQPKQAATVSSNEYFRQAPRSSKTLNACGVVASFTPARDSVFSDNFNQVFTNTSVNATSFDWYINGSRLYVSDPVLNWWFPDVGLYEMILVARNGNCTDTAVSYYLNTGNVPPQARKGYVLANYGLPDAAETATTLATLKDGGYLLGGFSFQYNSQEGDRGYLVKIKEAGCIEWSKLYQKELGGRISKVLALRDSGFLVAVSGYLKGILQRFDKDGNLRWQHTYPTGNTTLAFSSLYEAADGSILAGAGEGSFNGFMFLKLDAAGKALWGKSYLKQQADFGTPLGITELGDAFYVSGYIDNPNQEAPYNAEHNKDGFILSINRATGATYWAKTYGAVGYTDFFQDIHVYGDNLLVNDIRGRYLGGSLAQQTFHFIDPSGKVLKSTKVLNSPVLEYPFYTQILPLADGRLYLTQYGNESISLQPGYVRYSNWQKVDTNGTIYWQKVFSNYPRGGFQFNDVGAKESLVSLGTEANQLVKRYNLSSNFLLSKIDSAGFEQDYTCSYYNAQTKLVPDTIVTTPLLWKRDSLFTLTPGDVLTPPNTTYTQLRYACPDFLDSCSYLKLHGTTTLCNLTSTYTYRVSRNVGCMQPILWDVPKQVIVLIKNDSLLTVRFPSFGRFKIGALLGNVCTPIKDSLFVEAQSRASALHLGSDTVLCSGTTLTLHAGADFVHYKWQDGSTDSLLMVSKAGRYWVEVTDSCDNVLRDTILIGNADRLFVDLGPDRTKCNSDTLHLTAPSGFLNYAWSSNYSISSLTAQSVVIAPQVDTAYFLKAEKTPGCFAYDTVRVKVYHSPKVDLGEDQRFCFGDSALFNAGMGFATYQWNSGSNGQRLVAKTAGTYSVTATTAEGCKSYDTVKVLQVFPLPKVNLSKDPTLCLGDTRTLDASSFASYRWQDSSTLRTFTLRDTGRYYVGVVDNNGCTGSDTTAITTLLPLPQGYLPPDTAICSYGTLELKPSAGYNRYSWNTGATAPVIKVSQPGLYWLQVWDTNNCSGKDTVVVNPKQCMSGLYVPTAFSPNRDGKNDLFRPMLFGNVKQYRLTVYNRWGQVVFQTSDLQKGWNGKVASVEQETGVFVWFCTYQLEGEPVKQEKGTVTLVK